MSPLNFLAHGDHWHVDNIWLAIGAGLLAGILHTFTGPDHLGALMPLSVNRRLRAAWLGVRWGIGHSLGVFIVAILFMAGRHIGENAVDLSVVEEWGERVVALVLILLGAWALWRTARTQVHAHAHSHDGGPAHAHLHAHTADAHAADEKAGWHAHLHKHAAVGAGTLHGVAGMAHLLGVLPALAMPTKALGLAYLVCFAIGSVLSMAVFAGAFGMITAAIGGKSAALVKGTAYFAAVGCILIGLYWLIAPLVLPDEDHGHDHGMSAPAEPGVRRPT
ncbi:MAG: hypothetical protein HS108_06525 [Planctomycetes bacterium]|nr:hypothetical protein [Planctomycetota bacterium]MCL4729528.1 hypothetical protein [Planctomycetota bacterium]